MNNKKGIFALSPLIVFVTLYVVSSIIANDFYKMPISVAFMLASIYAVATSKGSMTERINTFKIGRAHV